jgi:hypothetical protein
MARVDAGGQRLLHGQVALRTVRLGRLSRGLVSEYVTAWCEAARRPMCTRWGLVKSSFRTT